MITRDIKNKMIGGVCAGLANYFGIEPLLVRVAFLFIFLGYGAGGLLYLILWLLLKPGDNNNNA